MGLEGDVRALDRTARPERAAYSMRALGRAGLPDVIHVRGVSYRLARSVKHDFFAATGFYDDPNGRRVVLKMGRVVDFAGVPLLWLGRWLCQREQRFYRALEDVPLIPRLIGTHGQTGIVIEYVPGQPLSSRAQVPDGFFAELQSLVATLHARQIAYVDANKIQNILVGDDGRPHLIDFQISWDLHEIGDWLVSRAILRHFQGEDRYHILKHKTRTRPDELTSAEREQAKRKSIFVRIHRFVLKPYFAFRRRTFQRLRETGRLLPEGSK